MTLAKKIITVMIIDDHPVVRDGYRRLLEKNQDIRVTTEADGGEDTIALYMEYAPDVVIIDINMPGMGGLEIIRRIKARDPRTRILVFSMHDGDTLVMRALEAGATGYLSKQSGMRQMVEAVQQVAIGKRYIDATLASRLACHQAFSSAEDPLKPLSIREFQIFRMLADGRSVVEIAAILSISPKTASTHHANIMKKLDIHNSVQLVRLALRCNVIES